MQIGQLHGHLGALDGAGLRKRVGHVVEHGFGHPVKEKADAHPRAKQHGKPAQIAEFGLGVRPADAQLPQRRDHDPDAGCQHDVHGQHQKPSGVGAHPILNA